jgi:hypothetical protein
MHGMCQAPVIQQDLATTCRMCALNASVAKDQRFLFNSDHESDL